MKALMIIMLFIVTLATTVASIGAIILNDVYLYAFVALAWLAIFSAIHTARY